jgi:glycosyltransferase involved in cell wall biosynthesis
VSRLIFLTQAYRRDSTIVGVTRDWARALAARCDGVDVIALDGEPDDDNAKVRVFDLGKGRGMGRGRQLVRLYRALALTLRGASAVFVHMVPRYALLAFPLARATRRPLALWYAQGGVSPALRAAIPLVRHILTPTRDSFPLTGPSVDRRLRVTGHGIDIRRFTSREGGKAHFRGRIFAAGRFSPSKRYEDLLAALPFIRGDAWYLRIASGSLYAPAGSYGAQFMDHVRRLGELQARISLLGSVPYEDMPAEYLRAWVFAHTSATGSLDKVVLEAMACYTPVVSTAPSSRPLLAPIEPILAPSSKPQALADALSTVLEWSEQRHWEVGRALCSVVERGHSLSGWADQVAALLAA